MTAVATSTSSRVAGSRECLCQLPWGPGWRACRSNDGRPSDESPHVPAAERHRMVSNPRELWGRQETRRSFDPKLRTVGGLTAGRGLQLARRAAVPLPPGEDLAWSITWLTG